MPETTDPAASALDEIRQLEHAATRGPWETEEGDNHWQLFGAVTPHMHPLQLIKAPKHGTPYAEYWPNEADSAFIAAARTDVPRLLAAVEAVLKLTEPDGEVHRDLEGNEEGGVVRVVRCDVLRETITAALAGKEAGHE